MRLSATDIDAFRRYRERDDVELADLLAQLRREAEPSEAMRAGSALHAFLETAGGSGEYEQAAVDGFTFDFSGIEGEVSLPAIREMKVEREYRIDGEPITLVGKVDAIHGRTVYDHKMTGRFDPERFLHSYQWRVYLEVFDADEFVWNVFEVKEAEPRHYRAVALHPLRMHRYPGMGEDVEREIASFLDMARTHLPERMEAA